MGVASAKALCQECACLLCWGKSIETYGAGEEWKRKTEGTGGVDGAGLYAEDWSPTSPVMCCSKALPSLRTE